MHDAKNPASRRMACCMGVLHHVAHGSLRQLLHVCRALCTPFRPASLSPPLQALKPVLQGPLHGCLLCTTACAC